MLAPCVHGVAVIAEMRRRAVRLAARAALVRLGSVAVLQAVQAQAVTEVEADAANIALKPENKRPKLLQDMCVYTGKFPINTHGMTSVHAF